MRKRPGSHYPIDQIIQRRTSSLDLSLLQDFFVERISNWFRLTDNSARTVAAISSVVLVIVIATIVDRLFRRLIGWLVPKIVDRLGSETPRAWKAAIEKRLVANRGAHIVGSLVFYWLIPYAIKDFPDALKVVQNIVEGYLIIIAVITVNAILGATRDVCNETDLKIGVPVRFAIQAAQMLVWVVGSILAVSVVFETSVTVLLSSLAGMTAILALVFRDSILGFVAGIQLSGNDMLNTGDWIDVPQYGASGTVDEIGLTTVKVRNFDKTISTVPSYSLVSQSFKNWRGMSEYNARRIKRSLKLDMNQIRFLTDQDVSRMRNIKGLESFWADREKQDTSKPETGDEEVTATSNLTNLSLLGDYLRFYLLHHPDICPDKTTMVRQLEPDPQGLPVEIYCFCSDINWIHYEAIQWNIMDHILAILPNFDLKAFQLPTSLEASAGSTS